MLFQKNLQRIRLLDQAADMVDQHLDGGAVFTAIGDDDIGVALAGLHKSLVHGLDGGAVLGDDAVQRAAPLLDIPQDAAEDPLVRVGVYIDLVIEQAAQLRLSQGQNALHDEDRGRAQYAAPRCCGCGWRNRTRGSR